MASLSEETRKKMSQARMGKVPWNKGIKTGYNKKQADKIRGRPSWNKGKTYPQMVGNKHRQGKSPWNKGKKFNAISGNRNCNWRGGVTPINEKIRKSIEYKLWRKAVYERDNYTCVWCGDNTSGNLNADHIKPFALFPELRFAIDNGRTLCKECHRKTETYGWNYWVNNKR